MAYIRILVRKYMLKYLGIKCQAICNFFSSGLVGEKICVCAVGMSVERKMSKQQNVNKCLNDACADVYHSLLSTFL